METLFIVENIVIVAAYSVLGALRLNVTVEAIFGRIIRHLKNHGAPRWAATLLVSAKLATATFLLTCAYDHSEMLASGFGHHDMVPMTLQAISSLFVAAAALAAPWIITAEDAEPDLDRTIT